MNCNKGGAWIDFLGDAHVTRKNDSANERPIERVFTGSGALEALVRPFGPVCIIPRACAHKVASELRKKLRVYGRLRHEACMP
jgi:hypothetical protein